MRSLRSFGGKTEQFARVHMTLWLQPKAKRVVIVI